ncbi:spore protease YyaC [Desulfoscipio gibsoniae]
MAIANQKFEDHTKKSRVHIDDPLASEKISRIIIDKFKHYGVFRHRPIVLLCIGTDRSTGDCLGPLVGSKLNFKHNEFYKLYGNLDHPVHAGNLQEYLSNIQQKYVDPFIIALDACLGSIDNIGNITIGDGSLQPGAGVNKSLPPVGHIYITGIVNVGGFMEYLVLQNTRLNLVMKMADIIVGGLSKVALEYWQENEVIAQ